MGGISGKEEQKLLIFLEFAASKQMARNLHHQEISVVGKLF